MTEQEWSNCNVPFHMLCHLDEAYSQRRLNLLATACFRRIWHLLPGPQSHHTVEVLELYADGLALAAELACAREKSWEDSKLLDEDDIRRRGVGAVYMDNVFDMLSAAADATDWGESPIAGEDYVPKPSEKAEEKAQCNVIREIVGNPFRPVTISSAWETVNVVALAQAIYDERAFDRMPILGDALEDAGCDNADILNHCRQPGEHVRGCWVVDLLLGKK
jgi:hypothetical protein